MARFAALSILGWIVRYARQAGRLLRSRKKEYVTRAGLQRPPSSERQTPLAGQTEDCARPLHRETPDWDASRLLRKAQDAPSFDLQNPKALILDFVREVLHGQTDRIWRRLPQPAD